MVVAKQLSAAHSYPSEQQPPLRLEGHMKRPVPQTLSSSRLSSPILDLTEEGGGVTVVTPKGRYPADFVIFATGFSVDFARRPEFAALDGRGLLRDVVARTTGFGFAVAELTTRAAPAADTEVGSGRVTVTMTSVREPKCWIVSKMKSCPSPPRSAYASRGERADG